MALMTVYHGGIKRLKSQKYKLIRIQKILAQDFIVPL